MDALLLREHRFSGLWLLGALVTTAGVVFVAMDMPTEVRAAWKRGGKTERGVDLLGWFLEVIVGSCF